MYGWKDLDSDLRHLKLVAFKDSKTSRYHSVSTDVDEDPNTPDKDVGKLIRACRALIVIACMILMPSLILCGVVVWTKRSQSSIPVNIDEYKEINHRALSKLQQNMNMHGPLWWLATYPHSGNTWIRRLWERSTNTTTGTVYQGSRSERGNFRGVHVTKCVSGVMNKDCAYLHNPNKSEAFLVKTHYPTFGEPKIETDVIAQGVITTIRSPTSWCDSHEKQVEGWDYFRIVKDYDHCVEFVKERMNYRRTWWELSGYDVLTVDYDFMKLSVQNARQEMHRIFDFVGVDGIHLEDALIEYPPNLHFT